MATVLVRTQPSKFCRCGWSTPVLPADVPWRFGSLESDSDLAASQRHGKACALWGLSGRWSTQVRIQILPPVGS